MDKPFKPVTHSQCNGYLPSYRKLLPADWYQFILLDDRHMYVNNLPTVVTLQRKSNS